ncbi:MULTISPECIES: hypothetical protein [Klebsiella]|uniref:Colicin V n=1 Tax=Klebsiella oxytoca TaxID=571 RepID=A0A9P0XLJ9_KLEOX|nr:hypothetical protein [Klebsiella oxytoca]EGT0044946.1 hypothetical protein [Klebsiella oxytoca]ELM5278743.1 hypothetical protein [Klebsiella oxytoca]ELP2756954.1 hypothetical protein [Klebsiella oxytoca]ELR0730647.1 hypothetical protein [Klebsiella oxytoca]ESM78093.1 hypothetical protein L388_00184 [Klebsiella oxytoca MGH 42]
MKQLTVFEMEEISGGYSWDFSSLGNALSSMAGNAVELVASVAVAASAGGMAGSVIGGRWGGAGGGILGFGAIGQGVGMIWGLVVGAIGCGIAGAFVGWDVVSTEAIALAEGVINGTTKLWS